MCLRPPAGTPWLNTLSTLSINVDMVEEDQEVCVTLWSQRAEINVSVNSGPGYFGLLAME
jgi:hypothetical protein